jgi:hypothetical protein
MLVTSPRRKCRDHEKRWRDFCVDKNLEEDWLERLNRLKSLNLVGVCEGHFDQRPSSASRFPYIGLRLKERLLPGIARDWEELRLSILNEVNKLFPAGDTNFDLELRFKLRAGRGRLIYQESLAVRMRSVQAAGSESMDTRTREWFEQSVKRIEALDAIIWAWYRGNLGAKRSVAGSQPVQDREP